MLDPNVIFVPSELTSLNDVETLQDGRMYTGMAELCSSSAATCFSASAIRTDLNSRQPRIYTPVSVDVTYLSFQEITQSRNNKGRTCREISS